MNPAQTPVPSAISCHCGENMRTKPLSFTRAEKLDTQNGIRKNRSVCQPSRERRVRAPHPAFSNSANPMMTLRPSEVSHSRALGSKWRARTTRYQSR